MDFVIGGLAAMGASIFSNPFDVLKTRMQLQGELKAKGHHAVHYKNVFHAAFVVYKNEGVRGLQKGLSAALLMHCVRNSTRLGIYQYLDRNGFITDEHGRIVTYKSALASSFSGAAGAFCGSPLFLIKTQLQSQAADTIAVGHQHKHRGALNAMKTIYQRNGVKGLWRGVDATMLRAMVGSSSQLTGYAKAKEFLQDYKIFQRSKVFTAFVASLIGGGLQAICMTPFDLVSTRLYNQPIDQFGKGLMYTGIPDCAVKIWKKEGFLGFYKGLGANYMRLGPHSIFTLMFWDGLKSLQHDYLT